MPKICSVEGCDRTDIQGRGWCGLHYNRWLRTGDPIKTKKYIRLGAGVKGSPEHNSWAAMKQRCYYKGHKQYKDYGGRGIKVCDRWLGPEGFIHFLEDMGERPKGDYSLDRIDVDGDYCPENCRWANRYKQNGNRKMNIYLTYNGKTHHITDWSKKVGIPDGALRQRYHKGWNTEKILTQPLRKIKRNTGR